MKSKYLIILLTIVFVTSLKLSAQVSTIWLLNGKKVYASEYQVDSSEFETGIVFYKNSEGKDKKKYIEDVFSIIDNSGNEKVYYKKNDMVGEILTPAQMRNYVQGLTDVLENYEAPKWIMFGGVASGLLGGVLPQPNFDAGDFHGSIPVGILVPAAYVGTVGATSVDLENIQNNNPSNVNDEYYKMGLQEGVQKKRIKKGLIGSAIGFATGVIAVSIISEVNN